MVLKDSHSEASIPNDSSFPTTQWLCEASTQWEAGVNTLDDGTEKENSTKDVCNAIRMNKGLFNEEAPLLLHFLCQSNCFIIPSGK